jgi:hypothetical protein
MIIKLSDYIIEQSISDASASDIALEQAKAEVEVTSAICEAYIKQFFMEADDENGKPQSSSGKSVSFIEKVKRFFISIGNWFRRMWIKFTGWLSEKKLARIIKKLENMSPKDQKNFSIAVPFATSDDVEHAINWFNDETNGFNARINSIINGEEYNIRNLQEDLSSIKKTEYSEYKPTETPRTVNYNTYLDCMKRLFDSYSKNKEEMKKNTASMKENKFEKLAAKMNGKDPNEVKVVYSYIKKIYQRYSAESSKFINLMMKYIGEAEKIQTNNSDYNKGFSQNDLDFLELMHLLAVALKKTDNF